MRNPCNPDQPPTITALRRALAAYRRAFRECGRDFLLLPGDEQDRRAANLQSTSEAMWRAVETLGEDGAVAEATKRRWWRRVEAALAS